MRPGRDWLAGCTLGAWAGFLLVEGFVLGATLMALFAIPAAIGRSLPAIGGLLVGAGLSVLLVVTLANLNCAGNYGEQDGACTPPDLSGWFVAGTTMAIAGGVLSVRTIARSRGHRP